MRKVLLPFKLMAQVSAFIIFSLNANAQSLPNVQKQSMRAPANIKIDGKVTEWDNKFQANNKATDLYYTLCNDDENIYLVVQVKYADVMRKIMRGGITFTINHTLNKKDEAPVNVTYPAFSTQNDVSLVTTSLAHKTQTLRDNNGAVIPMETSVDDLNKLIAEKSIFIKVTGIKSITDETISVYNEDGIKAVSNFEKPIAYIYELALPIKYLALPNNGADGFSYHIKINGPTQFAPPPITPGMRLAPPMPMMNTEAEPTDFWGEYTLAKK